jgi:hypothetical protein
MQVFKLVNGQNFAMHYKDCSVIAKTFTIMSTYFTRKSQVRLGIKVMLILILLVLGIGQKSWGQTLCSTGTWLGITSTDWNTAANWCEGIPTTSTNVAIPSGTAFQSTIGVSSVCNTITINSSATLIISRSNALTVTGTTTVGAVGDVVIIPTVTNQPTVIVALANALISLTFFSTTTATLPNL